MSSVPVGVLFLFTPLPLVVPCALSAVLNELGRLSSAETAGGCLPESDTDPPNPVSDTTRKLPTCDGSRLAGGDVSSVRAGLAATGGPLVVGSGEASGEGFSCVSVVGRDAAGDDALASANGFGCVLAKANTERGMLLHVGAW